MDAIINFIVSLFVRPINLEATCDNIYIFMSPKWAAGIDNNRRLYVWDYKHTFMYLITQRAVLVDREEDGKYRPVPKDDPIWEFIVRK
jgi:hypothetical protein